MLVDPDSILEEPRVQNMVSKTNTKSIKLPSWCILSDYTVPSRYFMGRDTVPSQYFLRDGTVPSRYFLRDGTVPSPNHYLKIIHMLRNMKKGNNFLPGYLYGSD